MGLNVRKKTLVRFGILIVVTFIIIVAVRINLTMKVPTINNKNKELTINDNDKEIIELSEEEIITGSISDIQALTQELYGQYYFGDISIKEFDIKVISRNEEENIYMIQSMAYLQDELYIGKDECYIGKDEITFRILPNGKIRFVSINHIENITLPKEMNKLQASIMPLGTLDLNKGVNHIEKVVYEKFAWWNEIKSFENFQVSEKYWNGKLYYCYSDLDKDIIAYVSSDFTKTTVICPNGSFTFDSPVVGYFAGASGQFYLKDITGDGIEEFIYMYGYGGTGVWESHIKVFNLETLKEYEIEDFIEKMERFITVEVESFELETELLTSDGLQSGIATCKVVDMLGNVEYGTVFAYAKEGTLPEYIPSNESGHYILDWNDELHRIEAKTSISLNYNRGQYLGGVSGYFIYDESEQCFKIADDFKFEIYEPLSDK